MWNLTFVFCSTFHLGFHFVQMWPLKFSKEIEEVSNPLDVKTARKLYLNLYFMFSAVRRDIQAIEGEQKTIQDAVEMH